MTIETVAGLRILVCGGAGGIGAAAVEGFLADGAKVAATYNRSSPPERLATAHWVQCDLSDNGAVDTAFDEAVGVLGGLDALIQAAGTWRGGTPEEVSADDFDFLFAANVKSTIFTNQAAFRHMKEKGGRIVNFGSSEGVAGNPVGALYAATRGAVHSWTRSAARAWGKHNITVNSIAPAMHTDLAEFSLNQRGPEARAAFEASLRQRIPIRGKLGDPAKDLYPMLRLLVGPGGGYITGQLMPVDGGLIMVGG